MKHTLLFCLSLLTLLVVGIDTASAQEYFSSKTYYDDLGQTTRIDYPDGSTVHFTYTNEVGVPDSVTYRWGQDSTVFLDAIQIDQAGLITSATSPLGQKTYQYDSSNRLLQMKFLYNGRTEYWAKDFTYNSRSQLETVTRQDTSMSGQLSFSYTEQGALRQFKSGAVTATYRYDSAGNLTSSTGFTTPSIEVPTYNTGSNAYDDRNHNVNWDYDQQGRLLQDDRYSYHYDKTGNLAMIRDTMTQIPLETYLYDAMGRRVRTSKIMDGTVIFTFRDDEGTIISEKIDYSDAPDEFINYIHHHGRLIGKMTKVEGEEVQRKSEFFNDYLGSAVVVVNDANIQSELNIYHNEYAPFGYQKANNANIGAPGYTGHEDDATDLTYMMARYLDGTAARFLTPDPARDFRLETPFTLNLYQYTYNDPLNLVDPTGLEVGPGQAWANRYAHQAFKEGNSLKGYALLGFGGFLSTGDGVSKVANAWAFGKGDEMTWKDYGNAALEISDVVKVGQVFKGGKKLAVAGLGMLGDGLHHAQKYITKAAAISPGLSDLLKSTEKVSKVKKSIQLTKKGGVEQARKDFESLVESSKPIEGGWVGKTKEGVSVTFRPVSKGKNGYDGPPSVDFGIGKDWFKVRYE